MLRVAQVMGQMNGGGVEAVVMNYYRHVDRSLVQFDLLVDSDSQMVPREEVESMGGRVFLVPPLRSLRQHQEALGNLFEYEGWKIVHSHRNALSVFPLRVAKAAGVPVRIAHSHSTSSPEERAKTAAKAALRLLANRYPTERFACGRYAGEWLFGRNASFWVMPNAIDLSLFAYSPELRTSLRSELSVGRDSFAVLHIGRFAKQKNHMFLLDVFRALLMRRPDATLLLAGEGPLRHEVERKACAYGISGSVRFLGQRGDPQALYSAADCFCLPSLYEGLPVVSVEAQASGLPLVMSTDVSPEAIITSYVQALPRSAGAERWADALASLALVRREETYTRADREALQGYDSTVQGMRLTERYIELAKEVGVGIG